MFFSKKPAGIKIFDGMDNAMPNFTIVATHVRLGKNRKSYILNDGNKLQSIVEKWRFKPGDAVGRCGYDYQIVFTNGDMEIPVSICFLCKTLIFNHKYVYRASKSQIQNLLEEDFNVL